MNDKIGWGFIGASNIAREHMAAATAVPTVIQTLRKSASTSPPASRSVCDMARANTGRAGGVV
jgi:hypothetical protein